MISIPGKEKPTQIGDLPSHPISRTRFLLCLRSTDRIPRKLFHASRIFTYQRTECRERLIVWIDHNVQEDPDATPRKNDEATDDQHGEETVQHIETGFPGALQSITSVYFNLACR